MIIKNAESRASGVAIFLLCFSQLSFAKTTEEFQKELSTYQGTELAQKAFAPFLNPSQKSFDFNDDFYVMFIDRADQSVAELTTRYAAELKKSETFSDIQTVNLQKAFLNDVNTILKLNESEAISESKASYGGADVPTDPSSAKQYYYDSDHINAHFTEATKQLAIHPGELGYAESMKQAYRHVFETLGQPIDLDFLTSLHSLATSQLTVTAPGFRNNRITSGLEGGVYVLDEKHLSLETKIESMMLNLIWYPDMVSRFPEKDKTKFLSIAEKAKHVNNEVVQSYEPNTLFNLGLVKSKKFLQLPSGSTTEEVFSRHSERYYFQIKNGQKSSEKLAAIALYLLGIQVAHLFEDGNQRLVAYLLLNKLLLENGFSPCILKDAFIFDGFNSIQEVAEEIRKGMDYYSQRYAR